MKTKTTEDEGGEKHTGFCIFKQYIWRGGEEGGGESRNKY